jgi:antitoxin ParD1/3/4
MSDHISEIEKYESKIIALKNDIQVGLKSPRVNNFNFEENLLKLKSKKKN